MNAFFQLIKTRLNTKVPQFKTVRMWNDQMNKRDTDKTEKPFPTPAVFVEFIINDTENRSFGIKDYLMTVRFHLSRVDYKFERNDTFDLTDAFDGAIQSMAPTNDLTFTFTTLQEITVDYDEDHNNVENPVRDYRTRLRYTPKTQLSTGSGRIVSLTPVYLLNIATPASALYSIDFSNPVDSQYLPLM